MDKYSIEDLITTAVAQKPADFASAFNDIIVDKLQSAIESRKEEIAQTMFNYQEKETPEE